MGCIGIQDVEWKESLFLCRRGSPKGYTHKLKWRVKTSLLHLHRTHKDTHAQTHTLTNTHKQTRKKKTLSLTIYTHILTSFFLSLFLAPPLFHTHSHEHTHTHTHTQTSPHHHPNWNGASAPRLEEKIVGGIKSAEWKRGGIGGKKQQQQYKTGERKWGWKEGDVFERREQG